MTFLSGRGQISLSIIVCVVLACSVSLNPAAAATTDLLYVGQENGDIHLCQPWPVPDVTKTEDTTPNPQCTRLNSFGSSVTAMEHGSNWFYAGTDSGTVMKCPLKKTDACTYKEKFGSAVNILLYAKGKLYAGTDGGTMLMCDPVSVNSCSDLNTFGSGILSMAVWKDHLLVGTKNGSLLTCDMKIANSCKNIDHGTGYPVTGIVAVHDHVFVADSALRKCELVESAINCNTVYTPKKTVYKSDHESIFYATRTYKAVNHVIVVFSVGRNVRDCADEHCIYWDYWERSEMVSCLSSTGLDCRSMNVSGDKVDTFAIGRAPKGTSIYYSINSGLWYLPSNLPSATNEYLVPSKITSVLYVNH